MKRFLLILIICLSAVLPLTAMAQDDPGIRSNQMIEVRGAEGKILVFPQAVSGPKGPVIKFVMFGITNTPEVIVVTKDAASSITITTIDFRQGDKFFGWFDVPQEAITELWINGYQIPWGNNQILNDAG
ncbi:MAG TPA: hypothetical protein PLV50_07130 [Smithella sp.]|nr:hypothetical protein [Smithella sp.]MDM7987392.1 hypothetical protein [Smithella sp.]HNY50571.1 hypothetical protein [Smithella sp.]HOG90293.1 hypothetical protein [Smithella sp.]HOU51947.1 hypothetical protein [Smithella sp.]